MCHHFFESDYSYTISGTYSIATTRLGDSDVTVKRKVKIFQNFVAFSEYINFFKTYFAKSMKLKAYSKSKTCFCETTKTAM